MAVWRKLWRRNLLAVSLLLYVLLHIMDARPANMSAFKDKTPPSKDENEILPPDHLNGVKMEMDGHLNKDFHQEVFLGKEMEEFDEDSEPRRNRKKLIDIFTKYKNFGIRAVDGFSRQQITAYIGSFRAIVPIKMSSTKVLVLATDKLRLLYKLYEVSNNIMENIPKSDFSLAQRQFSMSRERRVVAGNAGGNEGEEFVGVDINKDKSVSAKEMQRWIMEKTDEHFQEAMVENKNSFRAVDPDGDGHVTWDEYRVKFLASKGFNEKEIAEKIKNNEDLKLDEETQEVLESLKDRWFQADNPPADQLLNEQEFLSFLHPEHSRGMLKYMVKEIVRDLDQDGDKKLTLSEFISLPVGTVENQQAQDIDDDWVRERKKEFEEVIDSDRDGIVTMEELEEYMDPMNEHNALNEAKQMIAVADENQNHNLELDEILKYSEYFTGSKLMDYARNVHEEF